jgi:hypothetical protein
MTRFSTSLLAAVTLALALTAALPARAAPEKRHVIYYFTCDRSAWTAYMSGDQFHHTPINRNYGHMDRIIRYLTWDGSCWEARWNIAQRVFEHTPITRPGPMHPDVILNYLNWKNEKLTAKKTFDDYFMISGPH